MVETPKVQTPLTFQTVRACVCHEESQLNRDERFGGKDAPKEEWITIPVPALVDPVLFESVQEQLEENQRRARIPEVLSTLLSR